MIVVDRSRFSNDNVRICQIMELWFLKHEQA